MVIYFVNHHIRNGSNASLFEKMRGGNIVRAIKEERGGRPEAYIYEEGDKDAGLDTFWAAIGGKPKKIKSHKDGGDDADAAREAAESIKLFRLSDKRGQLTFTLEKTGNVKKTDLDSNDAFILDNGAEVFVWIGKKSSKDEKRLVSSILKFFILFLSHHYYELHFLILKMFSNSNFIF